MIVRTRLFQVDPAVGSRPTAAGEEGRQPALAKLPVYLPRQRHRFAAKHATRLTASL